MTLILSGPHPDLVIGVATWASPIPGDSGPHVGIFDMLIWSLPDPLPDPGTCSPPGPHLDLVNLVPIWASPSLGDFVPNLDLIAVDSFLASPGPGDTDLRVAQTWSLWSSPGHHWYLVTLFHT